MFNPAEPKWLCFHSLPPFPSPLDYDYKEVRHVASNLQVAGRFLLVCATEAPVVSSAGPDDEAWFIPIAKKGQYYGSLEDGLPFIRNSLARLHGCEPIEHLLFS